MMVSAVLCAPPYVLALEKARSEDDVTVCLLSCVYTATAVMAEKASNRWGADILVLVGLVAALKHVYTLQYSRQGVGKCTRRSMCDKLP